MIGRIERVTLKEVWPHEAHHFTTWLSENIDVLNEPLHLEFVGCEREQPCGDFNVDILAETKDGKHVAIENQYSRSNHDHLGKLITYLSNLENASIGIWIVEDARAEHVQAVTWLNKSMAADFYLVKLEAVRIGDSAPAPLLTLIVGPSEAGREAGKQRKELAERDQLRYKFWDQLLERARKKTNLHAAIGPGIYHWVGTSAGRRGLGFNYGLRQHSAAVELYIDLGKDQGAANTSIFSQLLEHRMEIEAAVGEQLSWDALDDKRACRISLTLNGGGWRDDEGHWSAIQDTLIDTMVRLSTALKPYIAQLRYPKLQRLGHDREGQVLAEPQEGGLGEEL